MGVVHGAPVRPAMVVAVLVSWARERLGSALYRQGRRGRASWEQVCWGRVTRGRRARPWQLGRPWQSPWRAMAQAGRVASSGSPAGSGATQTRGAGAVLGEGTTRGAARWLRRRTAAVGEVQGDGGGRIGQWQFRN